MTSKRRIDRRSFIGTSATAVASFVGTAAADESSPGNLRIGTFRFDVTPPIGHSLCGGWIKPVVGVDDPLEAIGYVLVGFGQPIVVCVVDWTGILNSAHLAWRRALAEATGTTIDRVTVHCVHQHNAPFACLDAEEIILAQGDLPHIVEKDFFNRCLDSARTAVKTAMKQTRSVTHIATGQSAVEKVASNRRIIGLNGKVISQRGSSSKSVDHHRLPEGLIDPMLKTVAFYSGTEKLVACHYYACHPMSYYGDGRVSADFCGLARKERQLQDPDCTHLYFNGCGGNIGAGKYNDGSKEMRPVLMSRILAGIAASEENLQPQAIESIRWTTQDILPPVSDRFDQDQLMQQIAEPGQPLSGRNRPSFTVAWIRRVQANIPITLSALHINDASMLHLPAECFVEYQLRVQASAPNRFVACAAYGDGGPWYIPTASAYPQGGYAVSVAWCDRQVDQILSGGIANLLSG